MGGASCDRHNPDPAHHRLYSVCIGVDEMSKPCDMHAELMVLESLAFVAFKKSALEVLNGRKNPEVQACKAVDPWETKLLGELSEALYCLTREEPITDENLYRMFELVGVGLDLEEMEA